MCTINTFVNFIYRRCLLKKNSDLNFVDFIKINRSEIFCIIPLATYSTDEFRGCN